MTEPRNTDPDFVWDVAINFYVDQLRQALPAGTTVSRARLLALMLAVATDAKGRCPYLMK